MAPVKFDAPTMTTTGSRTISNEIFNDGTTAEIENKINIGPCLNLTGMEFSLTVFNLCLLGIAGWWYYCYKARSPSAPLPPGPISLPIIGALFSLADPLHQHFASLKSKYGPIIYLKIGMVPYLVINSAQAAEQVLKVHDVEFGDRPHSQYFDAVSYGRKSMVFSPYGQTWRALRKIASGYLFSNSMLNVSAEFRRSELQIAVRSIFELSKDAKPVNLGKVFGDWISDSLSQTLFGKKGLDVLELVDTIVKQALNLNLGELIPAIDWLDLHGTNARMNKQLMPRLKSLLEQIIEEHRLNKAKAGDSFMCRDFTDVLISLKGEDILEDISIVALLSDVLLAGLDTSKVVLEWAMAEIISNPQVMVKAQEELDKVVGKSRYVQESDLPNLPYTQAIVKETLRLHPPTPLGVPHVNPSEVQLGGYIIPAGCKLLTNIWAIGRDPENWSDPDKFQPERFIGSSINITGQHFQLIPFSAGRRMCPGYPLAMRVISIGLATILQQFHWSSLGGSGVSLKEGPRNITCRMANALIVIARPRMALLQN